MPRRCRLTSTLSATRLAEGGGPSSSGDAAGSRGDAWLELTVAADIEAVEAVSEILGRVAPAGTSVEPAFELTDEGLGARVDPSRPAIVRAYLPARDEAAAARAVAEASLRC